MSKSRTAIILSSISDHVTPENAARLIDGDLTHIGTAISKKKDIMCFGGVYCREKYALLEFDVEKENYDLADSKTYFVGVEVSRWIQISIELKHENYFIEISPNISDESRLEEIKEALTKLIETK